MATIPAKRLAEQLLRAGPLALAYSRFDDKTRQEAHAEYLASIEPYRNGNEYDVPGEFVIGSGRRAQ